MVYQHILFNNVLSLIIKCLISFIKFISFLQFYEFHSLKFQVCTVPHVSHIYLSNSPYDFLNFSLSLKPSVSTHLKDLIHIHSFLKATINIRKIDSPLPKYRFIDFFQHRPVKTFPCSTCSMIER